ncbi:imidazolonepropionase [Gemmatimonas sp.]|jgi:imidazolonepropionase|uniref:imidazolonepropionase n=1 Tax=Gemmatimonas sp. TaxID=1962908 RepID=UPI0037BE5DDF
MADAVPTTLFLNAAQTITCAGPGRARRGAEMAEAGVVAGAGVAVQGERIVAVATDDTLRRSYPNAAEVDCGRRLLAPGFVDSHTHAVFGGARFAEQELRASGVPYMEIARRGGGIHSSVRDLRARNDDELLDLTVARLGRLAAGGVTTIEVKSGYGLTVHDELRTLRIIRRLAGEGPWRLVATCLGAHEIPLEYRDRPGGREAWIDTLCTELYPQVAAERLAAFADVFCEPGVFTVDEARRLLTAARGYGLLPKLHADELHDGGAALLAADIGAASADHLAAIAPAGMTALAASDTVATLLPATMLFLGTGRQAPARQLIEAGGAVALASDFNPGTSPLQSFPLVLTLGVSQLRMSAAEVWIAATVNGAAALGLATITGQLAVGYRADLAIHDVEDYRELPYWFGERLCAGSWMDGRACHVTP